jgi:molecular chaperone DnaJ
MSIATNYYEILEVNPKADQQTIKQAYRRLVKRFHPDSQGKERDRDRIILINAAYEVLGDPENRLRYDQQRYQGYVSASTRRQKRTATAQQQYRQAKQNERNSEIDLHYWLREVYYPVNHWVRAIIDPLEAQIDNLAADPFDDTLMTQFQAYIEESRDYLQTAHNLFKSQPNPAKVARTAAHLYYCLNQLGDALNELEWFTLNYDEHYLHAGQEMFRIAHRLHQQAQAAAP